MPIEDASVEWPADAAPFQTVATLRIPSQRFDSPEQLARCEAISFNPWHALVPHRPLGSMNRARRAIYEALAPFRAAVAVEDSGGPDCPPLSISQTEITSKPPIGVTALPASVSHTLN